MSGTKRLLIVNNIPTPYRAFMFRKLHEVGQKFGVEVAVFFQAQQERRRFWKPEEWRRISHTSSAVRTVWHRGEPVKYATWWTTNFDIIREVSRGHYDYVMMGGLQSFTQWTASFVPAGKTLKLLWSESNLQSTRRTKGPARWLKRAIMGNYGAPVCPGERAVEFIRFFNHCAAEKPVLWLPNIVDDSVFVERLKENREQREAIRQRLGIQPDECLFLAIGRDVDYKGFGYLIEAFRRVHGKYRLIVLGEGPLRGVWQQRVQSLGLSSVITLPGNVDENEVVPIWRRPIVRSSGPGRSVAFGHGRGHHGRVASCRIATSRQRTGSRG